ncbi:type II toxin-antitoxin system HipA family toxin [Caulobacter segnis]|uniref:type II toxin-antitoxin system HipA family toxin n=1 Tax=Caulobacter segnis TaxID=88688 RepID=UPI0024102483|nr:type II toxin-antitoxin system HipA family toxin [Caulobacter segnis]MDG2520636.1 type II toxin-antitoxin system HipA family toxin [Caulobacter segnis]
MQVLEVLLHDRKIGTLTDLGGDRSIFAFDEDYARDPLRPTLSLSFKDERGGLLVDHAPTQTKLPPFFSNLLPEGALRTFLARGAGVKPMREFRLLWALGADLPGAVVVRAPDGSRPEAGRLQEQAAGAAGPSDALRFSLAGVQLKFSALADNERGLTIPASGQGGDWIVKLPSPGFAGVAENEYAMMRLAAASGIEVPATRLVRMEEIGNLPAGLIDKAELAYAVERFDRSARGRVHIEDFAQILSVYPEDKYDRATYRFIAKVLWLETGEAGVTEFVRRLVFSALIGNADMHLKNWSLIYRDGLNAALSPAYDLVSTMVYIPDDGAALKVARSKRWDEFSLEELVNLAERARLPKQLVLTTALTMVEAFREVWTASSADPSIPAGVRQVIERQLRTVPLARR